MEDKLQLVVDPSQLRPVQVETFQIPLWCSPPVQAEHNCRQYCVCRALDREGGRRHVFTERNDTENLSVKHGFRRCDGDTGGRVMRLSFPDIF